MRQGATLHCQQACQILPLSQDGDVILDYVHLHLAILDPSLAATLTKVRSSEDCLQIPCCLNVLF